MASSGVLPKPRGEVLPVGMHVLRCRWVPHKYAAKNFDCKHPWAKVPLLVKPKPFNMTHLDNLRTPQDRGYGQEAPPETPGCRHHQGKRQCRVALPAKGGDGDARVTPHLPCEPKLERGGELSPRQLRLVVLPSILWFAGEWSLLKWLNSGLPSAVPGGGDFVAVDEDILTHCLPARQRAPRSAFYRRCRCRTATRSGLEGTSSCPQAQHWRT